MRTIAIFMLAVIGATFAAAVAPVRAQYYYPPPPPPPPYYYGYRTYNGCPPGYTVQGGGCRPYRGPVGGGWRTWNGCPPHYTVQDGVCKPYRGY
jgi:hypothetical protein